MIQTKKDLEFYIAADRIMNGLTAKVSLKELLQTDGGGIIIRYLRAMRKCAYYQNTIKNSLSLRRLMLAYWWRCFSALGLKLGFSIGPNSLGYGVVIPHYGTIVVHGDARIGNFAVLHTCTCVAGGDKIIGDYFYLSTGSQVVGNIKIGDGVTVAAHSLVNRSAESHTLLAGVPAEMKRSNYLLWTERDGMERRVEKVNRLLT